MENQFIEIKNYRLSHNVQVKPYTTDQLEGMDNVTSKVLIDLNDLIGNDNDWLNDEVSEIITGSVTGLHNIFYGIIGRRGTTEVILKVVAEVNKEEF